MRPKLVLVVLITACAANFPYRPQPYSLTSLRFGAVEFRSKSVAGYDLKKWADSLVKYLVEAGAEYEPNVKKIVVTIEKKSEKSGTVVLEGDVSGESLFSSFLIKLKPSDKTDSIDIPGRIAAQIVFDYARSKQILNNNGNHILMPH
jgi:hypothetical protein